MWAVVTFHGGEPTLVRVDHREGAQRLARRLKAKGSQVKCYRWAFLRFSVTKADLS